MNDLWSNEFAAEILPLLLRGLWVTVQITVAGTALALVLGLIVAVIRFPRIPVISHLFDFYVLFVRGTPLLVQAYLAYFALPAYGIRPPLFLLGIIVIGVNYSAYMAEVYRAGIEDVPKGQWEASTALNLPTGRVWSKIVLPQAVRSIIPMLGNYFIQMFKDSAILSAITVAELMLVAKQIGSSNFRYIEAFTIAALLYLVVSYPASRLIGRLERRLAIH